MADETNTEKITRLYREYNERAARDTFLGGKQPWIVMDRLVDVILTYVSGPVLEIGMGMSTLILAKHAQKAGVPFLTCDIKPSRCDWARADVKYDGLTVFQGSSFNFLKGLREAGTRVAVAFVDGDHSYGTVRMEVDVLVPMLLPGGVMFMHDTCPVPYRYEQRLAQGRKMKTWFVRKELERRDDVDVLTWRYTADECGLTMVFKKDMSEPEYRT